jgi:hypothetical protein
LVPQTVVKFNVSSSSHLPFVHFYPEGHFDLHGFRDRQRKIVPILYLACQINIHLKIMTIIEIESALSTEGQFQGFNTKGGHIVVQPVTEEMTPAATPEHHSPNGDGVIDATSFNLGTTDERARKLAATLTLEEQVSCPFCQSHDLWCLGACVSEYTQ